MPARSVAITYGFAEGKWQSRQLRKALQNAGFKIVDNPESANILIAHSAGSYTLPAHYDAQLILHIGGGYWPDRTLPQSLRRKLAFEYQLHRSQKQLAIWFRDSLLNSCYALNISKDLRLLKAWRQRSTYLGQLTPKNHVFVRNKHDSYCRSETLIEETADYALISMPGGHDDVWQSPEAYVALLESLLR